MHLLGTTEAPVPPDVPSLPGSVPIPKLNPPALHFPPAAPPKLPVLRLGEDPAVVFAKWGSRCDVAAPGKAGTADFISYYQHHDSNSAGAFPLSSLNYACGAGWVIIPGSSPVVPPVWIGKTQPFQPPTNMPGGQIFTGADVAGLQLMAELAGAGVPLASSGQLLAYGGDGTPIYVADWWSMSPVLKNAAAAILQRHDAFPHSMWATDPYHWGFGNVGVGLPTVKI